MTPRPLAAVFLDFDGVILESAEIKTRAFARLFAGHPRHVRRIVRYHERNAGVSRFKKFDHIFERILRAPLTESERGRLGRAFARIVREEILSCPFVPGAVSLLKRLQGRCLVFVISGTPQSELRSIVKKRSLSEYFNGVYGSPSTKDELLKRVLRRRGLEADATVFIGDAMTDLRAASSCAVPFVGRSPRGRGPFPAGVRVVRDLRGVFPLLRGRLSGTAR